MYCAKCGNSLESDAKFCSRCGTKVGETQPVTPASDRSPVLLTELEPFADTHQDMAPLYEITTRQEFYKYYASRKTTGWTTTFIVLCFLSAGLCLLLVCFGNYFALLDVAFYLIMGILLRATRHWVCALILSVYGSIGSLLSMASAGSMSGIFFIVASIICTVALIKINRAFHDYQNYGKIPQGEI